MRLPADDPLVRYAEAIAKAAHRAAGLTRQLLAFSRKQVIQPVILDLNFLIVEMEKCSAGSSEKTSRSSSRAMLAWRA
jgi:two-component system cell cycle sensor histidine kinase/response regulator CckA